MKAVADKITGQNASELNGGAIVLMTRPFNEEILSVIWMNELVQTSMIRMQIRRLKHRKST